MISKRICKWRLWCFLPIWDAEKVGCVAPTLKVTFSVTTVENGRVPFLHCPHVAIVRIAAWKKRTKLWSKGLREKQMVKLGSSHLKKVYWNSCRCFFDYLFNRQVKCKRQRIITSTQFQSFLWNSPLQLFLCWASIWIYSPNKELGHSPRHKCRGVSRKCTPADHWGELMDWFTSNNRRPCYWWQTRFIKHEPDQPPGDWPLIPSPLMCPMDIMLPWRFTMLSWSFSWSLM